MLNYGIIQNMYYFDRLPRSIRDYVNYAPKPITDFMKLYRQLENYGEEVVIESLKDTYDGF